MDALEKHTEIWMYRDSLESFFKEAWKVIEPETPLKWNWHHAYICEQLEHILLKVKHRETRVQDTIINVPPATLKSSLITIIFPVWCWLHSPHLKFITLSYAENLAIIHAVKSRDIIQSDWFQENFGSVFQLKFDVNKKSEYANDKGGSRIAIGMKGTATGKHADILICDDPLNPKMAASPVQLLEINDIWDNTIPTRLTDARTSQKIIVMQRLGVNDLTGHCLAKKEGMYRHICLPAEKSKYVIPHSLEEKYTDGLLDTERLSQVVLKSFRVALGSNNYSGQFSQNPIAEGGNLVRPEWFGRFHLHELEKRLYDAQEKIIWNVFVDGAYTKSELNCPTAILVAGQWANNLYIRDVSREWMELPDLVKQIPKVTDRNRMNGESAIIIEPKASGLSIGQMLRKYTPLNVILDKPPREGKTERLKSKLPYIEGQRVFLEASGGWIDMFVDELKAFPFGEFSDITDTLVMAIDRAEGDRAGSTIFGMGVTG